MTGVICDLVGPLSPSEERQIRHKRGCRGAKFVSLVGGFGEWHELCTHMACPKCQRHYCIAPQFGQRNRVVEMEDPPRWVQDRVRKRAAQGVMFK